MPRIDEGLVARLVAAQFPEWAGLAVSAVAPQGWDNRSFRVGDGLVARLPSAAGYAPQIAKEQRWLPHLAAHLPVPVPVPVALGRPGCGYPFAWSVSRWVDGEVLADGGIEVADDLGAFLTALRAVPAEGAPAAGPATAFRGGPLDHYAAEARHALDRLATAPAPAAAGPAGAPGGVGAVEAAAAREVFEGALTSRWERGAVWFHGDFGADNVLVRDGRLAAVLDFGCAGVGDPACDLTIAFTALDRGSRAAFRDRAGLDDDTWRRARGWAIWKAAITLTDPASPPRRRAESERALAAVRSGD